METARNALNADCVHYLDVQLLVVNGESLAEGRPQLCKIGEIGELFVRAGGLAEGRSIF